MTQEKFNLFIDGKPTSIVLSKKNISKLILTHLGEDISLDEITLLKEGYKNKIRETTPSFEELEATDFRIERIEEVERIEIVEKVEEKKSDVTTPLPPQGFGVSSFKINGKGELQDQWFKRNDEDICELDYDFIKRTLIKEIKPLHKPIKKTGTKTLLLFFGDAHIKMKLDNESPMSINTKDFQTSLLSTLNLITEPFKEVVVVYGGDMTDSIQNSTSRGGHHLPSTGTTREMFEEFISASKIFFTELINNSLVGNISFYSVNEDNHTGAMAGIYSRSLELWLNAKYPQIETQVFNEFLGTFYKEGHSFTITHGKDAKEQFKGLPLILDPKTENYLLRWFQAKGIIPNYKKNHIFKFDLHQYSSQLCSFFSYTNCLSMQTGSKWQQLNFMSNLSGITYSIINNDNLLTSNYFL